MPLAGSDVDHIMPILLPPEVNRNEVMRDLLSQVFKRQFIIQPLEYDRVSTYCECELPMSGGDFTD